MYLFRSKEDVANLAVVATILQFLSGILVCKQYVVDQTTAEASSFPFIAGILSSGVWLLYGLAKHNDKIVMVNTVGVTLMLSYIVVFYIYTIKKPTVLRQIAFTVIFFLTIFFYISVEEDNEILFTKLGHLARFLTVLTVGAPMSKLFYVFKVKCTECLPFPMILMSFFVSALWTLYGYIDEDIYIRVPNIIGIKLALAQLSLFVIFPSVPHSFLSYKSDEKSKFKNCYKISQFLERILRN